MVKINLLPWREELRKQKQQEFIAAIGAGVLFTALILAGVHFHIQGVQEYQTRRNQMIKDEIATLDRKIKEVDEIENKKSQMLAKIELIQNLQASRPEAVHLFDELARVTPEGIYLTSFTQTGAALTLNGKAESNARVSSYMRAIEASAWLSDPRLDEIKGGDKTKPNELSDFILYAKQINPSLPKEDENADEATAKRVRGQKK